MILGATGSIGAQTVEVCESSQGRLRIVGASAHSSWPRLYEIAREHQCQWVCLTDEAAAAQADGTRLPAGCELLVGEAGASALVSQPGVDTVVAAMVGAAGLRSTVAALTAGKTVALANKETLVVGGPLVTELVREHGGRILPVDSEHSAVFQCLQAGKREEVARVVLTGSGGPFRQRPLADFDSITPEEALRHPTWQMGPKITVDSATMMNKALEIIEAHWLFGLSAEQIQVILHPQSMVHSLVEFVDGSVFAQVSPPDMRLPIQYALEYPRRWTGPARRLDFRSATRWEFEPPDPARYPALALGYEVIRRGGTAGAALNAANEVAVERFLARKLRFSELVPLAANILARHPWEPRPTLEGLTRVDQWARREASQWE